MKILEINEEEFKKVFDKSYPKLKYKEFVGYRKDFSHCTCYRIRGKLAGFAITEEKELVNVFNAEEKYKLLEDPEVVKFIQKEVDWLCCLETKVYDDEFLGNVWKFGTTNCHISRYYEEKLGFGWTGMTRQDVGDMVESRGFSFTMDFIEKYGIPHHVFLVNLRGSHNSYPYEIDLGSDGYEKGKKLMLQYLKWRKDHEVDSIVS